jgi:hypothetical protein
MLPTLFIGRIVDLKGAKIINFEMTGQNQEVDWNTE